MSQMGQLKVLYTHHQYLAQGNILPNLLCFSIVFSYNKIIRFKN